MIVLDRHDIAAIQTAPDPDAALADRMTLSVADTIAIRQAYARGITMTGLAKRYGVSTATIRAVIRRRVREGV